MDCSTTITPASIPVLTDREFHEISGLAYEHFGLDLRAGKQGLVAARLGKLLRELGLKSFHLYYDYVKADRSGVALARMVDHLTTNHTSFFREPMHFEFLRKTVLPALRQHSPIRIWSAACATGEEPYSIALSLLQECPREAATRVTIKATDISTRVLEKAKLGVYELQRLSTIPADVLRRYTEKAEPGLGCLRFTQEVRSMIDFQYQNLMSTLPQGYRCQVIFCRNVMIYFDKPTQQNLVQRLSQHLEPGGYFFIGFSESLSNIQHDLNYISPAIYQKHSFGHIGRR